MSLLAFHPALRTTLNPFNPGQNVVRTVNLALDDPDNLPLKGRLKRVDVRHVKVPEYQVVETVGRYSPRQRKLRGLGVKMAWQLAIEFNVGGSAFVGDNSTGEEYLQALLDDLAVGMTGLQDGVSTYLWFSPNYRWNDPAEQWVRVVPKAGVQLDQMDPKPWGEKVGITLETERNFKAINWTLSRRGFTAAGAGTVQLTMGSAAVVGVGTNFLQDFIYGDWLLSPAGALLGIVLSVQSATAMTLQAVAGANYGPAAYVYRQRSAPSFLVPIYSFTEFEPSQGWGNTPWGQNWGSPTP